MTIEETRQLGIEVERRLQTIFPTFKLENKIDTEDIYSFLNQFQRQYVDSMYIQNDNTESGTRKSTIAEDVLRTLTTHCKLENGVVDNYDNNSVVYNIPSGYYRYIRSVSDITGTYKNDNAHEQVSNIQIMQSDANSVINQSYDKNRILRNPIVVIESGTGQQNQHGRIRVIHDVYTTINYVDLTYLRLPSNFNVLTSTPCELPYTCFEDLVAGAVDLYLKHLAAAQPKQHKQQEDQQ